MQCPFAFDWSAESALRFVYYKLKETGRLMRKINAVAKAFAKRASPGPLELKQFFEPNSGQSGGADRREALQEDDLRSSLQADQERYSNYNQSWRSFALSWNVRLVIDVVLHLIDFIAASTDAKANSKLELLTLDCSAELTLKVKCKLPVLDGTEMGGRLHVMQ